MKHYLAGVICFSSATNLFAQTPTLSNEAAIRQVVGKYVDARESIDSKAIEGLFMLSA
jgi:type IV secretory pathway component VirB8